MRSSEAVEALEQLWDLRAEKIRWVRSIFQVFTEREIYSLKVVSDKDSRILFYDSVIRHVCDNGFKYLAPYIYTKDGNTIGYYGGERLILTKWIKGREIDYKNLDQVSKSAKVMGQFNRLSRGYTPPENVKIRDRRGKWLNKMTRKAGNVEQYIKIAKENQNEFDKLFLDNSDWILEQSLLADDMIHNSAYKKKIKEIQICHGDPSKRNFLMDKEGQIYMIDFDSVRLDIVIADLWRFLRRILKKDQWEMEKIQHIIDGYTSEYPMDKDDYYILLTFLTYPQKTYHLVHKYYETRERNQKFEKKMLKKLNSAISQQERRCKFLNCYKKKFL